MLSNSHTLFCVSRNWVGSPSEILYNVKQFILLVCVVKSSLCSVNEGRLTRSNVVTCFQRYYGLDKGIFRRVIHNI